MTVNAETAKSGPYTGNGSTTVHAYAFKVLDQSHIVVTQTVVATGVETTLSITTHYSVSGVGTDGGGNITMVTAAPSTDTVTITRAVPQTQTTDLVNRGAVQPSVIETMGDRGVQMVQDFDETINRTLKLPVSTAAGISTELPAPVADAFIKWNAAADALESTITSVGQSLGGDGTVSLPYYSFSADPNSGMYRIGADNVGFAVGGSKVVDIVAAGLNVTGTTTSSGVLSVDDATDTSSGTTGSVHTDGGLGVAKKLYVGTSATISGVLTTGGNIVSDTDSTDDIGTNAVRWASAYIDALTLTDNATIGGDLTVTGNLTINGTTVTNDATNTEVKDPLIEINSGAGSNANDLGTVAERGSTGDNVFWGWDESSDRFVAGLTTATGSSTGNISFSAMAEVEFGNVVATGATFSGTSSNLGTVTTVDINGGTVDGAVIGGASSAAITGTTIKGDTSLELATGATVTGIDNGVVSTGSATLLATQGAINTAITATTKAPGIQMLWESDVDDSDKGSARCWANNATLSSATILYFDDVESNGVSINALIDALDDPTADNSATIYIQEAGTSTAGVVFQVDGDVVSAST